jgi:hypothetical protein
MTENYTFYLYFSYSVFYLIKVYEIILGRGSTVPERLRKSGLNNVNELIVYK